MTPAARHEVFARLAAADPNPSTELKYASPFQLLVSVILSAQATDKSVNQATAALFRDAPSPAAMLTLGVSGLSPYIRSIGLYNT
jgi:endonuclease-3